MKNLLIRTFLALLNTSPSYLISGSYARANGWGCQVILCLSNPGGATQFTECRPPIEKLWRELAKGHAFPSCNGLGFTASAPGYAPYYCDEGYRLTTRYNDRGRQASCISTTPQTVSNNECTRERGTHASGWYWDDGQRQCRRYVTMQPHVRLRPHYVDVTIDGIGSQRVWY